MSLTQIGVIIAGAWLILVGANSEPSTTLTLVAGIAIVVLVLIDSDFVQTYRTRA